jgi:hypothetical protein
MAEDKSNLRLNRRLMGKFKSVLEDMELKELPLNSRKFTWTSSQNPQTHPMMTRIDRAFCTTEWEELFPTANLHTWTSTISDHCPLILQGATAQAKFKGFRFEFYWLGLHGFQQVVRNAWRKPLQAIDPIRRLHIKLSRIAKALKQWEKSSIGNIKSQFTMAKEVLWQLDKAQERRLLSAAELGFRTKIKDTYLGLLAIEKMRAHQRSRLTNIKHGDASTKYFFP